MPNRAARRRTAKISELREQAIESLGQEPYIDIEGEKDPSIVVRIWHPLLVDDDAQRRLEIYNNSLDLKRKSDGTLEYPHVMIDGTPAEPSSIRSAKAILGEHEWERFIAAGGSSNDVQLFWNELVRQHEDADNVLGDIEEDDPK